MSEYAAVSSSSYDIESLVAKLNERAAAGWEVVSVVSTGGEVSAILRRDGGAAPAAPAEVEAEVEAPAPAPVVEEPAPVVDTWAEAAQPAPEPEPVSSWEPEPEPAPVVSSPVIDTPSFAPVEEPAGWGAVAEPEPTPEPSPVSPIEVSAPAAAPVQPASSTPAGWYPDPSGRYEVRYWDGLQWTEHVSRQGQQFTDPPVA